MKQRSILQALRIASVLLILVVGIGGFLWFDDFYISLLMATVIYGVYFLLLVLESGMERSRVLKEKQWRTSYRGYEVYSVKKEMVGTSNILVLKEKKKHCIIAEEELYMALNDEERTVCFLHEIGHFHTIPRKVIFIGEQVAIFLGLVGLNLQMFKGIVVITLVAFATFLVFWFLKRYIEYKADEYAIKQGGSVDALICAVGKAEKMNNIGNNMASSGHPAIQRREKRLRKLEKMRK